MAALVAAIALLAKRAGAGVHVAVGIVSTTIRLRCDRIPLTFGHSQKTQWPRMRSENLGCGCCRGERHLQLSSIFIFIGSEVVESPTIFRNLGFEAHYYMGENDLPPGPRSDEEVRDDETLELSLRDSDRPRLADMMAV